VNNSTIHARFNLDIHDQLGQNIVTFQPQEQAP
jgi:hypothetical protein